MTTTQLTSSAAQVEALTQINLDDFLESLGLAHLRRGRGPLRWLFRPAARRFAHVIAEFDKEVGERGLQAGSELILRRMTRKLEVAGRENIPADGPTLILANHPGITDTVALFASLPRPDLRVIASARPFLEALTHVSRQMIYIPTEGGDRMAVMRAAVSQLRQGRAVLTFPAGEIEPDPAALGVPGAVASLQNWSHSIGLFARLVPQTRIVPAIVSGVVSPAALRNPLIRLRRARKDRERMAVALQIMFTAYQNVTVRVAFGPPLTAAGLIAASADAAAITRLVAERARRLIESPPTTWETLLIGER
jgi:1-acyl-sn-glycerol-3-phosphate acyltransferase